MLFDLSVSEFLSCQRHYAYLCEDVVQIAYAPLEASAVGSEKCEAVLPSAFD